MTAQQIVLCPSSRQDAGVPLGTAHGMEQNLEALLRSYWQDSGIHSAGVPYAACETLSLLCLIFAAVAAECTTT